MSGTWSRRTGMGGVDIEGRGVLRAGSIRGALVVLFIVVLFIVVTLSSFGLPVAAGDPGGIPASESSNDSVADSMSAPMSDVETNPIELQRAEVSSLTRALRAGWARRLGGAGPPSAELTLTHGAAPSGTALGSGLRYYPSGGVRTVDGLGLSQQQAFLYGVRRFELNRGETALKGAGLVGTAGFFAGAMAASFGWLSEPDALWLAGGAAVLGAAYGAAAGYESTAWREEWRWPRTLEDESGVHVRVRPR